MLTPLEDYIMVEPVVKDNVTVAGIILEEKEDKPTRWKVVAVGKGKILDNWMRAPMDIVVGDTVYFTKYAPDEIQTGEWLDTKHFLLIRQSQIMAKEVLQS